MLDWLNRKPNKSAEELEYDRLTDEYAKKFGEPWAEKWGFAKPINETLDDIRKCISDNKKQELEKYMDNVLY